MAPPKIFVAMIITLACSNSKADWQYTKWGMSQEQVMVAGNGKIKREDRAKIALYPDIAPLIGNHTLPTGETAVVTFKFVSDRLVLVNLNGFSHRGSDLPMLLRQTYGAPIFRDKSPTACETERTEWRSEATNQYIILNELQCIPGQTTRALIYRPIYQPNSNGL